MTAWVAITDPNTATGAIITQALMRAYRDNMRSLAEDDASVPALDTIKRLGRQNRIVVGTSADDTINALQVDANAALKRVGSGPLRFNFSAGGAYANWIESDGAAGANWIRIACGNAEVARFDVSGDFTFTGAIGTTGTFTPSLVGTGGGSAHTYTVRTGWYRKIGKQVYFTLRIALSAKDGTMTGNISVSGLPFTVSSTPGIASVTVGLVEGFTRATAGSQLLTFANVSGTAVSLIESLVAYTNTQPAAIGAAFGIILSGTYETP
jgi:hypothetical protein